jgi:hypothetical protein
MNRRFLVAVLAFCCGAGGALAVSQVRRPVIASGGVGGAAAHHAARSTLGQSVAGGASSAHHAVNAGFWRGQTPPVSDAEVAHDGIPDRLRLFPARPNPSGPGLATVRYDVPAPGGPISIRVCDVGGRLVRLLIDGNVAPGHRSVVWDGRDAAGRHVPSGVYLCVFEAPGYRETQKIAYAR